MLYFVFNSCGGGGSSSATVKGFGSNFTLVSLSWGRLAEIIDHEGNLLGKKVISPSLASDSTHFTVVSNPITEITELQLIPNKGTALYKEAIQLLDHDSSGNSTLVTPTVRGPEDQIGFGVIPSNAALKLQFNLPIDFTTLSSNTVKFLVGNPPTVPFYGVFYPDLTDSSIVIFKPTISNLENISTGLAVNPIGFPRSIREVDGNLDLYLPTEVNPLIGQNVVLKSKDGQAVAAVNNPVLSSTGAINRRYRSGGDIDANGGFLIDTEPPKILGTQAMSISNVQSPPNLQPSRQRITFSINSGFCQDLIPVNEDVLVQGTAFGLVKSVISTGINNIVDVLVLSGVFSEGAGFYKTPYRELFHGDLKPCFVTIGPINENVAPTEEWLKNDSSFTVEFSEAIKNSTVLPFRTFAITNRDVDLDDSVDPDNSNLITDLGLAASDHGALWNSFVVGEIVPSVDRKRFRFVPLMELNDSKTYDLHLVWGNPVSGSEGIRDLAGNALNLTEDFRIEGMTVDPHEANKTTNVRVFRFKSIDLNEDAVSVYPETNVLSGSGQGRFVAPHGGISGRTATPYRRIMDDTQTFIGAMTPTPAGLQTPFVPLGARMMTLYRYHDVFGGQIPVGEIGGQGPHLDEKNTWHVDIKGFSWSPFGGTIFADQFDRFQILMGHSLYSPIVQVDTLNTTGPWQSTGFNTSNSNTDGAGGGVTEGSGPRRHFANQVFETARYIRAGAQVGMGRPRTVDDPEAEDQGFDVTNSVLDASPFLINPSKIYRLGAHDYIPFEDSDGKGFSRTVTWRDLTMIERSGNNLGNPFLGGGYANITTADINLQGSICGSLALNPIEGMDSTEFCRVQLTPTRSYNFHPSTGGAAPSASFPSIALPLLMEFRCYPGGGGAGNSLATSFMFSTNQNGSQNPPLNQDTLPASRIFSQGYRSNSGFQRVVTPNNPSVWENPRGGFNPGAQAETASHDPVLYWGVLDLQNTTSIFFSRWIDTEDANPVYGGVVVEPAIEDRPEGTEILVEFRAATSINESSSVAFNANALDPYGNCDTPHSNGVFSCTTPLSPIDGLTDWTHDITSLTGKRYLQMRVSLIANSETNLSPTVQGIGIVYQ